MHGVNLAVHLEGNHFSNRTGFDIVIRQLDFDTDSVHNRKSRDMQEASRGEPARKRLDEGNVPRNGMTIAVIIPTFNHARFLPESIMSVLAQTRRADEIIVVDDGSTDDPATVVTQFQTVRLIRQDNRGLSAARNKGLWNCKANYVVFLDADDRMRPTALEAGLSCITSRPDCAFVYGGHRLISEEGHFLLSDIVRPINGDAHHALARSNRVGPPAAALYRRNCLIAVNGFDEALRRCQDYDLYLRMAQRYPIASHSTVVAEYRKHGQAMSNDFVEMLKEVLLVLDLDEGRNATDALGRAALREGRAHYRNFYVSRMLDAAFVRWRMRHDIGILVRDMIQAARWSPFFAARRLLNGLGRRARKVLPRPVERWIARIIFRNMGG